MERRKDIRKLVGTPVWLAVGLWLCTLPLVLIVGGLFFGVARLLTVAAVVLVAYLVVCQYICRRDGQRATPPGAMR